MKHRVLSAIARPVVKNASQPWLCRRCLAQQATHANNSNQTPLILDSKSLTPESRRDSSTTAATAPAQDTNGESLSPQRRHKLTGKAKKRQLFLEGKLATTPDPERRAALWRTLKQELPHAIPPQYLIHVRRSILPPKDRHEQQHLFKWALEGYSNGEGGRKSEHAREIKGVVVSAGKMDRTVKVKVPWQRWEQKIRKFFTAYKNHLVHDPNNSLIQGDVVTMHRLRVAKTVEYVVGSIVSPFGKPIEDRPPVPTPEERLALYKEKRINKLARRTARRKAAAEQGEDGSIGSKEENKTPPEERAQENFKATEQLNRETAENLIENDEKAEELAKKGLVAESKIE